MGTRNEADNRAKSDRVFARSAPIGQACRVGAAVTWVSISENRRVPVSSFRSLESSHPKAAPIPPRSMGPLTG